MDSIMEGFPIIPHASIDDGYMDICAVDQLPKAKIPYMITKLLKKNLYHRKEVHYFKVKEATVICANHCNIDGEEKSMMSITSTYFLKVFKL